MIEKFKVCPRCKGHGGWWCEPYDDMLISDWRVCDKCNGRGMIEATDGKSWSEVVEDMCDLDFKEADDEHKLDG